MSPGGRAPALDVVIVGRGRVGRVLAARLRAAGLATRLLRGRGSAREGAAIRTARVIWLTVPDPALAAVEARVAALLPPRPRGVIAHASGATPPGALARCRAQGAAVAAAHPLVSFGTPRTTLSGATFVVDGDPRAVRALSRVIRALGARPVASSLHGPRYHAAAALSANGAAALAALSVEILVEQGLAPDEAASAIGALLRSVADNVARVGPIRALTGPVARGDVDAVARHLAALEGPRREGYRAVSRLVLDVAERAGLDRARAQAIRALLRG